MQQVEEEAPANKKRRRQRRKATQRVKAKKPSLLCEEMKMKPIETNEETGKISVQEMLKILRQEALNPQLNKSKQAKFWYQLLFFGIKLKFWKPQDSLEHAIKTMKAFNESFEEKLPYVV